MSKIYFFILTFTFTYCFCTVPDGYNLSKEGDSVFFTLPGQGSCAVIVKKIEGQNVAVVLDAGASSTRTHVKFLSDSSPHQFLRSSRSLNVDEDENGSCSMLESKRMRTEYTQALWKAHRSERDAAEPHDPEEITNFSSPIGHRALVVLSVNKVNTSARKRLNSNVITCQKETVSVDLGGKLKTLIESLQVTQMLVFLSHTDKDHINLIGHLPDVPAVFCVGGNVSSEKDIYLNSLLKNKKHAYRFDTYDRGSVVNTACGGFLHQLLQGEKEIDLQYFKNTQVLQKLNFLHLWLLNPHKPDTNSQSYIISATLEPQNMTMVFSGDATTLTFEHLKTELENEGLHTYEIIRRKIDRKDHTVLFSIPHHGSSHAFPEQIFDMFSPNAYLVNSGNGASYPHPHKNLIDYIESNTNPNYVKNFWCSHTLTAESAACTFARTTHGVDKDERILPILYNNNRNKPLVLGTNVSGAIYIDSRGVFSQDYSNSVEIQGRDYTIQYNHHAFTGLKNNDKFQFSGWATHLNKTGDSTYYEADNILYKNKEAYAKIYYSPASKEWLGYLLQPVMNGHSEYDSSDEDCGISDTSSQASNDKNSLQAPDGTNKSLLL